MLFWYVFIVGTIKRGLMVDQVISVIQVVLLVTDADLIEAHFLPLFGLFAVEPGAASDLLPVTDGVRHQLMTIPLGVMELTVFYGSVVFWTERRTLTPTTIVGVAFATTRLALALSLTFAFIGAFARGIVCPQVRARRGRGTLVVRWVRRS